MISKDKIDFTIIIPCYKEHERLPKFLENLSILIKNSNIKILIIDDGSPENYFDLLKTNVSKFLNKNIELHHYEKNIGKGHAIAYGINLAKTKYVGFLDADGSIGEKEVFRMVNYFRKNSEIDMLISSRIAMLGRTIDRKISRHVTGRIFATISNILFPIQVYDSQCGFKLFSKAKYENVKNKIIDNQWLWDTQLLILFYYSGFKILEFPIDWSEKENSKIRFFRDALKMFFGLIKFKKQLEFNGAKKI